MRQPRSLFEAFDHHLQTKPDHLLYRYLVHGEPSGETEEWSFADLYTRSAGVAEFLCEKSLQDRRVLLLYPPGLDYIATFFGCLMARAVAIPAYPPDPSPRKPCLRRLLAIAEAARIDAVVTASAIAAAAQSVVQGTSLGRVPWLCTDNLRAPPSRADWLSVADREEGALAYLQFTSGSTSDPRGVMVTHGNIVHNSELIRIKVGHNADSRGMLWLPPYHDMGLIVGIIHPLHVGFEMTLMSPLDFLKRPTRWIEAVSRFRATTSGGPDFAFALCARRFHPGSEAIDLSSWRVAFSGAEPIHPQTLDRFTAVFGPHGFDGRAFWPCYGLAEATLIATGGDPTAWPARVRADCHELARGRFAPAKDDASAHELVSCGTPAADQRLEIVDPDRCIRLGPGVVGEIWLSGPSVSPGYCNQPDATEATFSARLADEPEAGPFARTGDLGFVVAGELYVTGRRKDLIIVRGRNLYPQDIEYTVTAAHPAIRPGCVAAFAASSGGADGVAIAAEVQDEAREDLAAVTAAIRGAVAAAHDVAVAEVALLPPRAMPKTSSGKLTRGACRDGVADGSIETLAHWRADDAVHDARGWPVESPPPIESAARLRTWLCQALSRRTKLPAGDIDTRRPLVEYGLDSQTSVELAGELEAALGRRVPATLVWDHPTIDAICTHLSRTETAAHSAAAVPAPSLGRQPIAIVSIGCRFPGGIDGPQSYWQLLCDGRNPIGGVPKSRWDREHAGAHAPVASHFGGFIDDVDQFDASFFAISPREAESLDPQQRLLLEVSWEALERAGLATRDLAGSPTGVFIGISSNDYYRRQERAGALDPRYAITGNTTSIAAGRISHALGLVGPTLVVDTACSSSLVAVHLACQSLRAGECDQALAGGVNLILSPEGHLYLGAMHAISPTGRCAAFDASADGYVRSEGCAVVLLKRLDDARRAGDPVVAVIRDSAINHDGSTNGLTAPSGPAQEAVIRKALAGAGVRPDQVGYVEAHGTGTALGDPIEVEALAAVFGPGRPVDRPLRIGSAKSNIGHTEAAAGVAGLIKAALALEAARLPANLHFHTPNPHLPWAESPIAVVNQSLPWPAGDAPRFAGVSSFGMSGTNAHVVLEEAPRSDPRGDDRTEGTPQIFPLAAHNGEALLARIGQLEHHLDDHSKDRAWADLAFTVATSGSHLPYRAAVVAGTGDELRAGLAAITRSRGRRGSSKKLAFLFTGQGAQRPGMGRDLAERWPVFADTLRRCDELFSATSGLPKGLREVMWCSSDAPGAELLDRTEYTQPALFAFEYSLARLWCSLGVVPDLVIGHSVGEFAAACAAGVMGLEDAFELVTARGRGMGQLPPGGAMYSLDAGEDEVRNALRRWPETAIAAVNGPRQVVVAGREDSITGLVQELAAAGRTAVRLPVSHAFHSPLMEPMVEEFARRARAIRYRVPEATFISTVTGAVASRELAGADYWIEHVRAPVRFLQAMAAVDDEVDILVELGPQPNLLSLAHRALPPADRCFQPCARRGCGEDRALLAAVAALHERGVDVDWRSLFERTRRRVAFPGYPWQHRRYWIDAPEPAAPVLAPAARVASPPSAHGDEHAPLAGRQQMSARALRITLEQLDLMREQLRLIQASAGRPESSTSRIPKDSN
ncbi:beta-ketoacyl synthase N-terminal-like domain-containing protein [Nannocystis sp. ILAH1]|uniref:type I polyketide synthase n=1 Tax=unclassified Nannocystis TaxID=2627009 RepID=UPI00226F4FBF|nr:MULTISPECIES: type I polyketide synthase [unclassified Nannocystis]MCY0989540.1 beta-ketoacyl synthase N-terminal-like domain-containing protein [Nannocystis sp. ILAH1]MCY1064840.1 beta-ketoacyl synthase N-terminal-like domain-containing protein [Nannocystis sp. RBIL2]